MCLKVIIQHNYKETVKIYAKTNYIILSSPFLAAILVALLVSNLAINMAGKKAKLK